MQLHIVIQQNPLLNKANLKEKKKKKKEQFATSESRNWRSSKCLFSRATRHPGGNIFPPVSGNQCTDNVNISMAFFAIKLLAHSWQKYVVKLP